MEPFERKELLEKIDRDSSFVGAEIPEKVELDGTELDLSSYVVKVRSEGSADDLVEKKKKLRRKRMDLYNRLKDQAGGIEYGEGCEIADKIQGLDRALTSLEQVGRSQELEVEEMAKEKADQQRWKNFLDKIKGESSGDRRRHG
ncbi:MAG: DUF5788 family protein [Halobacteria archaeon]